MEYQTLPAPPQPIADDVWASGYGVEHAEAGFAALPRTGASEYLLLGVRHGSVTCSIDENSWQMGENTALLVPPETEGTLRLETRAQIALIGLRGALSVRLLEETRQTGGCFFPRGGDGVYETARRFSQLNEGEQYDAKRGAALLFSLLMGVYRRSEPVTDAAYPELVRQAIALMQRDYAYLYGIDELAERLSVSKSHLIRVFSAAVGIAPGRYLTQLRVEHAKRMLSSGDASIDVIAAATGFSSAAYFGKVFRRTTGLTPTRFAAAVRQRDELPGALYL